MDDEEILGRLLKIEAEAAALVDDAQADADRRISEGERRNRADYEERYGREAVEMEADYQKEIAVVKDQYQKELDACRGKLNAIAADTRRFSALMEELLAGER
jgi:vacuolar-type H+-ATPase subunit H